MPLKTVTFDLWETLIADSPEPNDRRTAHRVAEIGRVLKEGGLPVAAEVLERAHSDVWDECSRHWEKAQDLPFGDQVSRFLEFARPGLSSSLDPEALERISDIYATAALLFPPAPIPGASEALSILRTSGLQLGLICNTGRTPGKTLRKLLSGMGLLDFFAVTLFSDETIVRKPDAQIFHRALEVLGTAPNQALHVGDSLENDVHGALGAGMRAVWINPALQVSSPAPVALSVAEVPRFLGTYIQNVG